MFRPELSGRNNRKLYYRGSGKEGFHCIPSYYLQKVKAKLFREVERLQEMIPQKEI